MTLNIKKIVELEKLNENKLYLFSSANARVFLKFLTLR